MTATANPGQNSFRRPLRAAALTLVAFVLYACGGDDPAPAARSTPDPMPGPGGSGLEPMPEPAIFSSSDTVNAALNLLQLNQIDDMAADEPGAGVAVAAVIRNLPDLAAAELQPKATAGDIQLRDAAGAAITRTTADAYIAAHDLGRFGDGTFIAHILAGQSANPASATDPDIPGLSPGVNDLDIYALNYLASPAPRSGEAGAPPDYDAPVDFSDMQAMTTTVLNHVTGPATADGTDSRRRIVLFSNPVVPLELIPGVGCEDAGGDLIDPGPIRASRVATLDICVRRGVEANFDTHRAPAASGGTLPAPASADWFYDQASALTSGGKSNADTYPTIVVPAGDLLPSHTLFVAPPDGNGTLEDAAGGYIAPVGQSVSYLPVHTALQNAFGAISSADHDTTPYSGPLSLYARLPGLEGTIARDSGSSVALNANFEHILVVVGVQAGGDDNGVIHPASSRCGGGQMLPDTSDASVTLIAAGRIQLACIAAPASYQAVVAASGQPRIIGRPSVDLLADPATMAAPEVPFNYAPAAADQGAYGSIGNTFGRVTFSYSDRLFVRSTEFSRTLTVSDSGVTNFAAPLAVTEVAAAVATASLAIVAGRFSGPTTMSNKQILQRLKSTANKEGIYTRADIYGHGLIDLAKATSATGTSSLTPLLHC